MFSLLEFVKPRRQVAQDAKVLGVRRTAKVHRDPVLVSTSAAVLSINTGWF